MGSNRRQVEAVFRVGPGRMGQTDHDDMATLTGQKDQLVGKIQERYGIAKAEAEAQAEKWSRALRACEERKHASQLGHVWRWRPPYRVGAAAKEGYSECRSRIVKWVSLPVLLAGSMFSRFAGGLRIPAESPGLSGRSGDRAPRGCVPRVRFRGLLHRGRGGFQSAGAGTSKIFLLMAFAGIAALTGIYMAAQPRPAAAWTVLKWSHLE